MDISGMQDRSSQGTIPYNSENDRGGLEFVAVQSGEYAYTNSRKSVTDGKISAPLNQNPFNPTFTKNTWKTIPDVQFANYDQDSIISDVVAKNIEEGMADINSGRTYTTDQVKKMLGL